jgi:hypothetical protein
MKLDGQGVGVVVEFYMSVFIKEVVEVLGCMGFPEDKAELALLVASENTAQKLNKAIGIKEEPSIMGELTIKNGKAQVTIKGRKDSFAQGGIVKEAKGKVII